MNADQLQRWASILRWVGLSVTAIGLLITFGSHYIADKLHVVQRADKASAQERLKQSEAELQTTKARTAELEKKLAPRQLSPEQRKHFIAALAGSPRGPIAVVYSNPQPETINFATEIRSLLIEAGFQVAAPPEHTFAFTIDPPAPWFISLVAVRGTEPPYAEPLYRAWRTIGVENGYTDGIQFAKPGELKIYIESK